MQAITQAVIEVTKAAVQAMAVTGAEAGTVSRNKAVNMCPRSDRPSQKQLSFNGTATDKYIDLRNCSLKVNKIFQTYNTNYLRKLPIFKDWLGGHSLQFIEGLKEAEQEECRTVEDLFKTLNRRFRPQNNETILLLQYFKLSKHHNQNTKEGISILYIMAVKC